MAITIYHGNNHNSSSHLWCSCCVPGTVRFVKVMSEPSERPSEVSIIISALELRGVQAQEGNMTCPGLHSECGAGAGWELPRCEPGPLMGFLQAYSPSPQTCKYTLQAQEQPSMMVLRCFPEWPGRASLSSQTLSPSGGPCQFPQTQGAAAHTGCLSGWAQPSSPSRSPSGCHLVMPVLNRPQFPSEDASETGSVCSSQVQTTGPQK